ncbi:SulP family inorganic anion transporter [Gordonia jinhuaensis]|uniref:SulP family inorganic anion transporter n=1 Tax=Gordonia jinhuaensis TaxID=1517702 RepID=A0A916TAK0_9ACTN|nr:SulP family inorganic anion transporter [Gordonia jinhuaensis]GGB37112.1 SulP family inorganic anion transporter [Gordonia jinhuaensis]
MATTGDVLRRGLRSARPAWISGYRRTWIRPDLIAGITLAAITIPECMGYASIAGVPVEIGLYTILLPTIAFAFIGASRLLVVGADSATAALLASGLAGLGLVGLRPHTGEWISLCAITAAVTGVFLLLAWLLRLGFLADFLSAAVLIGFLSGVGVQVAIGQIPDMLGIPKRHGGDWLLQQWYLLTNLSHTRVIDACFAAVALLVMLALRRWAPKVPGAILVLVIGIVVVAATDLDATVVGHLRSGLPPLGIPRQLDWTHLVQVGGIAFGCFVVIIAQSAATARSFATAHGERVDINRDMAGLGAANVFASLSSAFVVNGSPTKTKIADSAGARTQMSSLVMSACVVVTLLFLTGILANMPTAVLAAVVFLIGIDLVDISGLQRLWRERRMEFVVALLTAVTVCVIGVEQGIFLAVIASIVAMLRRQYHPDQFVVGVGRPDHDGNPVRTYTPAQPGLESAPGLLVFRYDADLFFANANRFSDDVQQLVTAAPHRVIWLVLDCSAIGDVDYSATIVLNQLIDFVHSRGAAFVLAGLDPELQKDLRILGVLSRLRSDHVFTTVDGAIDEFHRRHPQVAGDS